MGRAGSGGGGGGFSSGGHSGGFSSGGHSMSHSRAGSGSGGFGNSHGGSFHGGGMPSHGPSPAPHGPSPVPPRGPHGPGPIPPHRPYVSHTTYVNNYGTGEITPVLNAVYETNRIRRKIVNTIVAIIALCVILQFVVAIATVGSSSVKSTKNREKLTQVASFNSNCVVDQISWFDNVNSAGSKLKTFYDETGIQPYVYLLSYNSSLTSESDKVAYAENLFQSLGLADNAFLYVYFAEQDTDNDVGYMCYVAGTRASAVLDDEAIDIFWSYIDNYWYTDYSTDEMFQKVYTKTANTIMTKSKTFADVAYIFAIILVICVIAVVTVIIIGKKKEASAAKAEETERILNTPMQDLVKSSENDPLIDKYK
jgi:hypothetical protein